MKKSTKSGFLLTATTKHSQELFDSANFKTRSRINLLATTGSSQLRYPKTYSTINPEESVPAPSMNARMTKIAFEFQLISQDIRTEQCQLQSSKQFLDKVKNRIHKNTNNILTSLTAQLIELQGNLAKQVAINKERTKQLNNQLASRKQKFEHIHQKMGFLGVRIKRIQDTLGTYTGNDEISYC